MTSPQDIVEEGPSQQAGVPPDPTPPPPNLLFWQFTTLYGQRAALNLAHVTIVLETDAGTDIITSNGGNFPTAMTMEEALRQIADLRAGEVLAPIPPTEPPA